MNAAKHIHVRFCLLPLPDFPLMFIIFTAMNPFFSFSTHCFCGNVIVFHSIWSLNLSGKSLKFCILVSWFVISPHVIDFHSKRTIYCFLFTWILVYSYIFCLLETKRIFDDLVYRKFSKNFVYSWSCF